MRRLRNNQRPPGRLILYEYSRRQVSDTNKVKATERSPRATREIQRRIRNDVASSVPRAEEPGLETLRRSIATNSNRTWAVRLQELLIPKCKPFRAEC